ARARRASRQGGGRTAPAARGGRKPMVNSTRPPWSPPETPKANPPYLDKVRAMIRSTPVDGFIGCAAALSDHDFRSPVATVTRPLLFIVGEKDGPQPAAMRDMHQKVPGSRYVELPGAGHISNMAQPALFTKAIAEFLAA